MSHLLRLRIALGSIQPIIGVIIAIVFWVTDKEEGKDIWKAIQSGAPWYLLARLLLSVITEFFPFDPLSKTRVRYYGAMSCLIIRPLIRLVSGIGKASKRVFLLALPSSHWFSDCLSSMNGTWSSPLLKNFSILFTVATLPGTFQLKMVNTIFMSINNFPGMNVQQIICFLSTFWLWWMTILAFVVDNGVCQVLLQ